MSKLAFPIILLSLSFSISAAPNGNDKDNHHKSKNATQKTSEIAAKLAKKGNITAAKKVSPN
ncbi:MAG: hypothetical protein L3J75_04145 [Methylococcaceae bacterium]|nr:hypothetical protein [Methylococcaceae bacterium]